MPCFGPKAFSVPPVSNLSWLQDHCVIMSEHRQEHGAKISNIPSLDSHEWPLLCSLPIIAVAPALFLPASEQSLRADWRGFQSFQQGLQDFLSELPGRGAWAFCQSSQGFPQVVLESSSSFFREANLGPALSGAFLSQLGQLHSFSKHLTGP